VAGCEGVKEQAAVGLLLEQGNEGPYQEDANGSDFSGTSSVQVTVAFFDSKGNEIDANFSGSAMEKVTQKPLPPNAKKAVVTSTVTVKFTGSTM
jgi:hypothetical protein